MQNDSTQPAHDVVLRSSDGALFYSWKIILSISSPVFNVMFTLPQQNNLKPHSSDDGRPIIDLSEDKRTIEHLLSLCHPPSCSGKKFQIETLDELCAVLEAATKYDMMNLRLVALEELTNPAFLRLDPVRVYALACMYEHRKAAQLAAQHTSALPTLLARGYVPEFEKVHAGLLCRLVLYREECAAAARALAEDHTWIVYSEDMSPLFSGCDNYVECTTVRHPPSRKYPEGGEDFVYAHVWWMDYMRSSACALQSFPHSDAVKDPKLVDQVLSEMSSSECEECKAPQSWGAFRCFVNKFAKEIDERVAKVEINVGF